MKIDLNCDLGEGMGNDEQIMPLISSCNIACGGHVGTSNSIKEAITLAIKHHVKIGAHPSYPDSDHFGRKSMHLTKDAFISSVQLQLDRFFTIANELGIKVHHIKAHGALYNDLNVNNVLCKWYVEALSPYIDDIKIYLPYKSNLVKYIEREDCLVYEAFVDRNYNDDLTLVSRKQPHAIISAPDDVVAHLLYMISSNSVKTISGAINTIVASTYCIHGDHKDVISILEKIHLACKNNGIRIE